MEIVLPSSPVWYQTKASDTSSDGYFAFASRNLVYILDIRGDIPRHYGILSGHEERVTSCCFCHKRPSSDVLYLVSAGDDSTVKVWNVYARTVAHEIKANSAGKISAVHWSPTSDHMIAFGDDKGCLGVWDLHKASYNKYFPDSGHQQISCVVFSPYYCHLVAVGYKSGFVSIININNKGTVHRKLRGLDKEIQSIAWSFYPRENILSVSKPDQENERVHGPSPPQQADSSTDLVPSNEVAECSDEEGPGHYNSKTRSFFDNTTCETNNPEGKLEAILVAGSKDGAIRLWSLSDGKALKTLKVSSKLSKGKRSKDDSTRLYVTLHWPRDSESRFVSSSYNGDILLWDLTKSDKELCQVLSGNSPDSCHQRVVFNINPGVRPRSLITTSMDRHIKLWSLDAPQSPPVCSLPTLGGFVYSIAISPIDPSLVAVGVGDGAIRIWKTKNPRNPFDITILWQGVKEKVMSMAWHPSGEGLLAFGTEDGKVGLYDVFSLRAPTLSETYHQKPVYAMSWGPRCSVGEGGQTDLCLFTCGGEGVVFMHPPSLKGDVVDIATIIATNNPGHHPGRRSEVTWRSSHDLVALGNDNGSFDIYHAPFLHHLITVNVHTKLINCLRWCPVPSDHEFHNRIASGSNTSHVCVTDLTTNLQSVILAPSGGDNDTASKPVISEAYRTLCGHNGRITDLSWNANNPSQLVSSSYDGTLQVWDVKQGEGLSNYRGHSGRILCVGWSPVPDKDAESGSIFSGADDYSVHVWRSDKQENKMPPKDNQLVGYTQKQSSQRKRKGKPKKTTRDGSAAPPAASNGFHDDGRLDIDQLLERKKMELLKDIEQQDGSLDKEHISSGANVAHPSALGGLNPNAQPWKYSAPSSDDVLMELSATRKVAMETKDDDVSSHKSRRRRFKNLFPLSAALDNRNKEQQQDDCIDIVRFSNDQLSRHIPNRPNLGLYGDRRSVYRMLHKEDEKLVEAGNFDGSHALKLWRADVIGAIESAIERNDLTDQLVAMAPMAGYDVWLRACESFADQLEQEGLHLHAANYLLACNKVSEAIKLLRDNKYYREAVAMARARLPDNDELLLATVKTWAHRLKNGGSLEMAAKCFASIKEHKMAAECLADRASTKTSLLGKDDIRSLFCATVLAKSAGLEDSHQFAKRALLDIATCSGKWKDGQTAARSFNTDLTEIQLLLSVHELLCTRLQSNTAFSLADTFADHACNAWTESEDLEGNNFAKKVLFIWSRHILDSPSHDVYVTLLRDVEPYLMTSSTVDLTLKQSLYRISLLLTCALITVCITSASPMTSHNQGCKKYVTSCRAISDLGETMKCLLHEIYESVSSLSRDDIPVWSSTNPFTSSGDDAKLDDVTNSLSKIVLPCRDVTKTESPSNNVDHNDAVIT